VIQEPTWNMHSRPAVATPIASVAVCSNTGRGRCGKEAGDSNRQGWWFAATPIASVAVCSKTCRGDHTWEAEGQ
jgi:hypothetical protein